MGLLVVAVDQESMINRPKVACVMEIKGGNVVILSFRKKKAQQTQSSTFADDLAVLDSEHLGRDEDIFDFFEKFRTQADIVPRHEGDGQVIETGSI